MRGVCGFLKPMPAVASELVPHDTYAAATRRRDSRWMVLAVNVYELREAVGFVLVAPVAPVARCFG